MKNRNLQKANPRQQVMEETLVIFAYTPSRPEPSQAAGDGFMAIPDGVDDEGLPFN